MSNRFAALLALLFPVAAFTGCDAPSAPSDSDSAAPEHSASEFSDAERKKKSLYVEPVTNASLQADLWLATDPVGSSLMDGLAAHQTAIWIGDWIGDVTGTVDDIVSRAGSDLQTLVVYNIPNRDCGAWSAGGAADDAAYAAFIDDIAAGLGGRHAIVVLEPDGLALEDCLSADQVTDRQALLADAVDTLTAAGGRVYIDAGDSDWVPSGDMATRLADANVANAAGFALNVSHTETTSDSAAYAEELRAILGNTAHYVVDTGRNGLGPTVDHQWCNPLGRAVGDFPTLSTGITGMDAELWVKPPGDSDGSCNGGPPAGAWWADYARDLAELGGV